MTTFIPSSLCLEIGKAFCSMHELEPILLSVLGQIQNITGSDDGSIWLLAQEGLELKCTHAVGSKSGEMMGSAMRARNLVSAYRNAARPQEAVYDSQNFIWIGAKPRHQFFNMDDGNIMIVPLTARGELLGMVNVTRTAGKPAFTPDDREFMFEFSKYIAAAIQNTQLYERQNLTAARQKTLNQVSAHLQQTLDIDKLISLIFGEVNKAINAEAQSIWLVNQEEGIIKCRFATGPNSTVMQGLSVRLDAPSIVGASISKQKSIIIMDAKNDPRHAHSVDIKTGFVTRSLMTVPLVLEDKAIGAIQAVNKRDQQHFTKDDLHLFRSIADSAALAVNNAQLVADLQNSYDLTLDALSAALDLRDRDTEGHSRRVVEYTARLAKQIGIDDEETLKTICRGALIHDIGKIGVPDAILLKPSELTAEERRIIERHPQAGHDMLVGIPYLQDEIKIVLSHQEKWDGSGYPFGLRGEEIILGARLFMVADTFDALTSDRPYRQSCPYEVARKIIEDESGKQFDPKAVEAFLAIPAEEWTQIRAQVMEKIKQPHIL